VAFPHLFKSSYQDNPCWKSFNHYTIPYDSLDRNRPLIHQIKHFKPLTMSSVQHPFLLSVEDVAQRYSTNTDTGLTSAQVAELRRNNAPNELDGGDGVPAWKILVGVP
jgi:hypothetical protein